MTTDPTRIVIASFHENKGACLGAVCDSTFVIKYRLETVLVAAETEETVYDAVIDENCLQRRRNIAAMP